MRARIIFRGLTLFLFERLVDASNRNGGTLTALLINGPQHAGGLHEHRPRFSFLGRDANTDDVEAVPVERPLPRESRFELLGHGVDPGVVCSDSFLDYVPDLQAVHWGPRGQLNEEFVGARIVIPHGTIRSREFVAWEAYGNTPSPIGYMDTTWCGFASNEVIVDVGDDSDGVKTDEAKFLRLQSGHGRQRDLIPLVRAGTHVDATDPNTVEVLVTNFAPQRRRAVPWSLHVQYLWEAMGFPPRPPVSGDVPYLRKNQFRAFEQFARNYDEIEWERDLKDVGLLGQPFAYIHEFPKLTALSREGEPCLPEPAPPVPDTRQAGDLPEDQHGGGSHDPATHDPGTHDASTHDPVTHDPWARPICPFGRI